jgi:hypothetical protein
MSTTVRHQSRTSTEGTQESSNDEDFKVVDMCSDGNVPYQDKHLAVAGQEYALDIEGDKDGIPIETLRKPFQ